MYRQRSNFHTSTLTIRACRAVAFCPVQVRAYTATCAVGAGKAALLAAITTHRLALRRNAFGRHTLATWVDQVDGPDAHLPASIARWDCRNHRLAWRGLCADAFIDAAQAARRRHGAARGAVVTGTSTSSIGETEEAYAQLGASGRFPAHMSRQEMHTPHSISAFVGRAMADGLSLFEALALERQAALRVPLSATLALDLRLHGRGVEPSP